MGGLVDEDRAAALRVERADRRTLRERREEEPGGVDELPSVGCHGLRPLEGRRFGRARIAADPVVRLPGQETDEGRSDQERTEDDARPDRGATPLHRSVTGGLTSAPWLTRTASEPGAERVVAR